MSRKRILLVEDDLQIQKMLTEQIESMGFDLITAQDGELGLQLALSTSVALVILDVNLPKLGGIEVCRQIRQHLADLPIIMLSARGAEMDKVLALQLGADDYVVKPFSVAELGARIHARLRQRPQPDAPIAPTLCEEEFVAGPFEINLAKRTIANDGVLVTLTALEFDLFTLLAKRPGVVFSRDDLVTQLWGLAPEVYENSPTAVVRRLRKKVEPDPSKPRYILTVWSVGYRFADLSELA